MKDNYRIRREFVSVLKGFPEFRIMDTESEAYVNVALNDFNSTSRYSRWVATYFQLPYRSDKNLVDQLFKALEKDNLGLAELAYVATVFKEYLVMAKRIGTERAYNQLIPFIIAGFFLLLMGTLLAFPASTGILVCIGLLGSFYALGSLIFLRWSFHKNEQALSQLKAKLLEKTYSPQAILPACGHSSSFLSSEEIKEFSIKTANASIDSQTTQYGLYSVPAPSLASSSSQSTLHSRENLNSNASLPSSTRSVSTRYNI